MKFNNIDDAYNYIKKEINDKGYVYKDQRGDKVKTLPFITIKFTDFITNVGNIKIIPIPKSSKISTHGLTDYADQLLCGDKHDFVYTYGERFIEYFGINQYNIMIDKLLNDKNTRRAIALTFDVKKDNFKDEVPCLQYIQLSINDNKLYMTVLFRSNDISYAFSSNMFGLMNLYIYFLYHLGVEVGEFNYVGNNVHIKDDDIVGV